LGPGWLHEIKHDGFRREGIMRAILTIVAICIGASSALAQQEQPCPGSGGPLSNFLPWAECEFERASRLTNYVRIDGAPADSAQEQATLAQCKDEAATSVATRKIIVLDACMARNGYTHPQR
jgi:hypothetical protein